MRNGFMGDVPQIVIGTNRKDAKSAKFAKVLVSGC
jgi:hypothetical protein